ncbi:short-chain dehydrogenase/reductase [Xylariales sp. AK1849]|nr:short-chain dehydrogenase/reductase [Xylariales sp. AK1849]
MSAIFKAANTAVITGGASGIGLALAKKCAGYGMKVLVADYDTKSLDAVPGVVGKNATTFHMDVSKAEDWSGLKSKVESEFGGKISLLSLNAGIGAKSSFDDPDTSVFQTIMATNLFGVINGITALLPVVKSTATSESSPSAIVITGSKQGITNPPGNPAYNASKSAVKTLAEHLSYDLRDTPISVHLLVPGWTWTGLAGGVAGAIRENAEGAAARKPDAAWWPEEVADFLERKMADGQFWVLCPDNEVDETTDRKRMAWTAGDAVNGRKPLSRWRGEHKGEVGEFMAKDL